LWKGGRPRGGGPTAVRPVTDASQATRAAAVRNDLPCPHCGGSGRIADLDAALLAAIAQHVGAGIAFTSVELLSHARAVDGALRHAVEGRSARQIGKALHRVADCEIDGYHVERIGEESHGVVWCVYGSGRALPSRP
jgi:hypothetical protein